MIELCLARHLALLQQAKFYQEHCEILARAIPESWPRSPQDGVPARWCRPCCNVRVLGIVIITMGESRMCRQSHPIFGGEEHESFSGLRGELRPGYAFHVAVSVSFRLLQ